MEEHTAAVAEIAAQVRDCRSRGVPYRIYYGAMRSTRKLAFQHEVDVSGLSNVLRIDREESVALVEPNVSMKALVEATLRHGLVPPVVMDFPGITTGGGFDGAAGKNSSFKYGLFDNTINWVEVILADGDIVIASNTERTDLFHAAAASLGTLGIIALLEIKLVQAKKYVKLLYHPVTGVSDAKRKIEDAAKDRSIDYIDGILYSKDYGVVITGKLTNTPYVRIQQFTRAHDPWFYLHVKNVTTGIAVPKVVIETVPLVDYLFRYDRGAFWTGATTFQYFLIPFNWFTRWLFDPLMCTKALYHLLHKSGHAQSMVIQDVALPGFTVEQFIDWSVKALGIYPLWICPLRPNQHKSLHRSTLATTANTAEGELLLNIGIWGPVRCARGQYVALNRALEQALKELGGMKRLYAHAFYTDEEFWSVYDRDWYDALRRNYGDEDGASTSPSVYENISGDVDDQERALSMIWQTWPFIELKGLVKAVVGGGYALAKKWWLVVGGH